MFIVCSFDWQLHLSQKLDTVSSLKVLLRQQQSCNDSYLFWTRGSVDSTLLLPDWRYGFHVSSNHLYCRLKCRLICMTGHPASELQVNIRHLCNVILAMAFFFLFVCVLIKIEASFPSCSSWRKKKHPAATISAGTSFKKSSPRRSQLPPGVSASDKLLYLWIYDSNRLSQILFHVSAVPETTCLWLQTHTSDQIARKGISDFGSRVQSLSCTETFSLKLNINYRMKIGCQKIYLTMKVLCWQGIRMFGSHTNEFPVMTRWWV